MVDAGQDDVPNDPKEGMNSIPDEYPSSSERQSRIGLVVPFALVLISIFVLISFHLIIQDALDESAKGPLTAESCIMDSYFSTMVGSWFGYFNVTVVNDGDATFDVFVVRAFVSFYQQGQQVNASLFEWAIVLHPGQIAYITEWIQIPFEPIPGEVYQYRVVIDWGSGRSGPYHFDQTV